MPESLDPTPSEATPTLKKSDQNLVWLDCEMSGLDPEKERLLEIAVVVTGPDRLREARELCDGILAGIGRVADRFDPRSELSGLAGDGRPQVLSPLLSDLLGEALTAASLTGGACDPTGRRQAAQVGGARRARSSWTACTLAACRAARCASVPGCDECVPGPQRLCTAGR